MRTLDILEKVSAMNLEYGDTVNIDGVEVLYSDQIDIAVGFFIEVLADVKSLRGWEIPSKEVIANYVDLYNSGSKDVPSIFIDYATNEILDGNHRVGMAKKLKLKQLKAWAYIGDEI